MSDWREFFERHRDYSVQASFYECRRDFSMEELYAAFKARLLSELIEAAGARGEDDLACVLERVADQTTERHGERHD